MSIFFVINFVLVKMHLHCLILTLKKKQWMLKRWFLTFSKFFSHCSTRNYTRTYGFEDFCKCSGFSIPTKNIYNFVDTISSTTWSKFRNRIWKIHKSIGEILKVSSDSYAKWNACFKCRWYHKKKQNSCKTLST